MLIFVDVSKWLSGWSTFENLIKKSIYKYIEGIFLYLGYKIYISNVFLVFIIAANSDSKKIPYH